MRKLDILVPHYKESEEVIKPLLDSLAIQQSVDLSDIGVIIVDDGPDCADIPVGFLNGYPFVVEHYVSEEHKGVSATRNKCLDLSTADYVMFCDADDMFCSVFGLYLIIREIDREGGFDTLTSVFTEETRDKDKNVVYINRQMDSTFVHGKVHRRKYLINNNIRWNEQLTIHEDSYFNCLCQKLCAPARSKYCPTPFYLWKWRDESVCRHDALYLNKTYVNMMDSNTALVNQFIDRGREAEAILYATSMIYDVYYSLNCDRWWEGDGKNYLETTEKRFKIYWNDFKKLFDKVSKEDRLKIVAGIKNRFFGEGLVMERITFNDWIKHIESI